MTSLSLLMILMLFQSVNSVHLPIDCANIPPSFYCKNEELAKHCDVHNLCEKIEEKAFGKKIHMTLLYETLCPDSQRFFPKLVEFIEEYGQFVDLEMVPLGNAQYAQNGTLLCQHGPDECLGNKYHACALQVIPNPLPYLNCTMLYWLYKIPLMDSLQICEPYITQRELIEMRKCVYDGTADRIQQINFNRTKSGWPERHQGVPWMFFNGVSMRAAQFHMRDLSAAICDWYQGNEAAPKRCDKLS
ncbi:unnamed protein product [Bursaphelenchus xylophilus]|nr:unnamed protein product [Bursaphelenchus xylophilus]CAG9111716.1 unnamed protein product [Bursaphelenchus xylophilus]